MNDNFLYELRTQPSPQFAARLKARLDLQTSEARQKRRALKWFVFGAVLMGGTALAFVSPSVRQAAWTMVVQFRGSPIEADVTTQPVLERTLAATTFGSVSNDPTMTEGHAAGDGGTRILESQKGAVTEEGKAEAARPVANAAGPLYVGADTRIPTVRIAHVASLQKLAEDLALGVEKQIKFAKIELVERPAESRCARHFGTAGFDVLLSDRQLESCSRSASALEFPLAYDPLILVIHRENTWARAVSLDDLRKMRGWPSNPTTTWSQVRSEWPTLPLSFAGATREQTAAGRRLLEAIGWPRDYQLKIDGFSPMKDDRATLLWLEAGINGLGAIEWRSLSKAIEERSFVATVVAIAGADGPAVEPTRKNVSEGRYPLARSLWIYVDPDRLSRNEVYSVMRQLLSQGSSEAIERSGLVGVARDEQENAVQRLRQAVTGPKRF